MFITNLFIYHRTDCLSIVDPLLTCTFHDKKNKHQGNG